uniref:Integrase zinc-binding domain-containing protein n=1 Tax=Sipha flava TaxID=143950 RepID=A0A2S2Q4Z5_9HEMI
MRWKTYNRKCKRFTMEIGSEELRSAKATLIKIVQNQYFHEEIKCLRSKINVGKRSKLKLLCPFIDEYGILRVGGRLNNLQTTDVDKRNPILLPAQSKLTSLIFTYEHYRQLHVGPQALLASIRENYWPMNGRNIARTIVNKCIICFKTKPYTFQPIMGDLPKSRVQPGRAFAITGVDFACPIKTKTSIRRNA